jgi:flagellar biosynthetic protein FliR
MEAVHFNTSQLAQWSAAVFWPLVRVLALISTAPALSHRALPVRAKVALALAVALVMAPQIAAPPLERAHDAAFFSLLVRNMVIGGMLGFAVRIVFTGLELAGQMIGLQIGLSFGGFFNPEAADTDNPVANVVSLVVLLLFLGIDGHLQMIAGLRQSFDAFPIDGANSPPLAFDAVAGLGAQLFAVALSLSLPVLSVMLLINIVLGVMARVSPQLNLFAVGFPITLCAGLVVLVLFIPYLEAPMRAALERSFSIWAGG